MKTPSILDARSLRTAPSLVIVAALFGASSTAAARESEPKQSASIAPVWAAVNVGADGSRVQQYASSPATITTSGTNGTYSVVLNGAAFNVQGNVQVVATGTAATRCKVTLHSPNGRGHTIGVRCASADGTTIASSFTLVFQTRFVGGTGAYLRYDANAAALNSSLSWASAGSNSVSKAATGRYTATLGALDPNSAVHVTATGLNDSYCNVESWSGTTVTVACFGGNGQPTDSGFSLLATPQATRYAMIGGHARVEIVNGAWAAPAATSVVVGARPSVPGSLSVTGQTVSFERTFSSVTWPLFSLVTAFGPAAGFCKVSSAQWVESSRAAVVTPSCFAANGSAIARPLVTSVATTAAPQEPPG
ncbi:MAG: hypothetical protein JNK05_24795 [Myxococcales bacterium]|nr:hypothetical protein [Myxococcales bacterium]